MKPSKLSLRQLVFYGAPAGALSLASIPITAVLPTLYAKHAAITLTSVGLVFTFRTIFDALSDQIIGYLSDRTRTRLGARKPWLMAGSVIVAVSVWYLFRIPHDAGIMYFGFWTFAFYIGYTMFNIPHYAWGNELSGDYQERAKIFAFKGFSESTGSLLISLVPISLAFIGLTDTEELTPEVIYILGLIVIIALPSLTMGAVLFTPHVANENSERTSIRSLITSVSGNKPFIRFLSAYVLAGVGTGFMAALIFPFTSEYLKIGSSFPLLLLVIKVSEMASIPIWVKLVARFGKHRCWAVGWAISAVTPFSLLADLVDYDILRTRVDRAGNYFAMVMFVAKMLGAMGGVALILLGSVFGYDLSEGAVNDDFATAGLVGMFILAPAVFQLAAVPLIWNFPINKRRQGIIRRRIEQRQERAARDAAAAESGASSP